MKEKLKHGKIYDCRIYQGMRKALYIGRFYTNRRLKKNVILTRPYRGEGAMAYNFGDDYTIKETELEINENINKLKQTQAEQKYAEEILEKYGL